MPAFLQEFHRAFGQRAIGWNDNIGKMLPGDQIVRDVCATCNNKVLSMLDAYAKKFFIENKLLVQNYADSSVLLNYNYDLLLRWNLKVSYNASRKTNAQSYLFEDHIPYILAKAPTPPKHSVSFLAQLMRGHRFYGEQAADLFQAGYGDSRGNSNPFLVRVSFGVDLADRYPVHKARVNIFGPLKLVMLIFEQGVTPGAAAVIRRRYMSDFPNTAVLEPGKRAQHLAQGAKTWLEEYEPQIRRTQALKGQSTS
jgi:hypothetical protein